MSSPKTNPNPRNAPQQNAPRRTRPIDPRPSRALSHFSLLTSHIVAIWATILVAGSATSASAADLAIPPTHPRLLLTRDDVAVIRTRCGTPGTTTAPAGKARFGSQRDVLERLRDATREIMANPPREDDLIAPAMLHLATGQLDQPDEYSRYVAEALLDPHRRTYELDALLALDWCWDAIEPDTRASICDRLPPVPEAFDDTISPLEHLIFYRRLCALAGCIVRYEPAGPALAQNDRLQRTIAAGEKYLAGPFANFCRQRGAMPTSPERGIWEEADYCLALELLRTGTGRNLWPDLADSLGRSLEHYFYADTEHPALNHGFIHDDGTEIPPHPAETFRGFVPAVPWVIARATRDPAAVWYAHRSLPRQGKVIPSADRYGWVRLVYGPQDDSEAQRSACPLARNFGGGWVAMRSGWSPRDTVLLFDAGQPYWQSRQHFDAGQFQIYRQGRLAVPSGDDVTFEATGTKKGRVSIGGQPGDWDRYFQSTIAHNCITITDRKNVQSLYDRPWPALGNQRLIGHNYAPADGDLEKAGRITGHLLAFETNAYYSYAAADLTPAYLPEVAQAVRREILMLNAGAVLVVDRVATPSDKSLKTWHLQLSSLPELLRTANAAAPTLKQVFGTNPNAGIWEVLNSDWLSLTQQEGRLFVRTLLPAKVTRRVIGGPMEPRKIAGGPFAGKTYFGGATNGFEYRLWPAMFTDGPAAAYELGQPTSLGAQFGTGATWGRLDVYPTENAEEVVFFHLLIPTDKATTEPPAVQFEAQPTSATLALTLPGQQISTTISLGAPRGGAVTIRDPSGRTLLEQALTSDIKPDPALPRVPAR